MAETLNYSLPEGITDQNGNKVHFLDIHRAFAETPMGQALGTKPRYDLYRPDFTLPEEWERLLGRDVNNLEHMPLTYEQAQAFLKNMKATDPSADGCNPITVKPRDLVHFHPAASPDAGQPNEWRDARFSAREIQILLLTSIVHDWAEADPSLGDIIYDQKLEKDEKKESQILILMLRNQLGEILSPEMLGCVHKTATDKTGKLGEAFNVIERLGYLRTALNAWQEQEVDNPYRSTDSDSLIWLCSNVLANQIPALLKLFPHYEGVRCALDNAFPLINRAFSLIPDSIFNRYPESKREEQREKYMSAKRDWDSFFHNPQP